MVSEKFEKALEKAVEKAFTKLFAEHPETYYYCSLITAEFACPYISAMSEEAWNRMMEEQKITDEEEQLNRKWSYADSPYCAYGWEYFDEVSRIFAEEENIDDEEWADSLLDCMERVMKHLDEKGLFGSGEKRAKILVGAEVMPPDFTNTERALRLNKAENIAEWLEEMAEEEF